MFKEFKEFAVKGNAVDLAVGVIIAAAFGAIVKSFVDDMVMPPIGLLLGNIDFSNLYILLKPGTTIAPPYSSLMDAKAAGAVTINYGFFINTVVSFLIIAFAAFLLVRSLNRLKQEKITPVSPALASTKTCPHCQSTISVKATRCAYCTSELKVA